MRLRVTIDDPSGKTNCTVLYTAFRENQPDSIDLITQPACSLCDTSSIILLEAMFCSYQFLASQLSTQADITVVNLSPT